MDSRAVADHDTFHKLHASFTDSIHVQITACCKDVRFVVAHDAGDEKRRFATRATVDFFEDRWHPEDVPVSVALIDVRFAQ